jgi:hypothetical protein
MSTEPSTQGDAVSAQPAEVTDRTTGEITNVDRERTLFSAWLAKQREGALHGELTDELAALAAAVARHEKPGTLTLKVTIKPGEDGADYLVISDEVSAKPPQPPRSPSLFYADSDGNLSRNNPRQPQLPLREVGGGKGASK